MSIKKYRWRSYSNFKVGADVAAAELDRIRQDQGKITAKAVVEAATDEDAPLHPAFEWDDSKAAQEHREHQARQMISSLHVTIVGAEDVGPTRAYVNVRRETEDRAYTDICTVMSDEDLRQEMVRNALVEVRLWQKRHAQLRELAGIFKAIDQTPVPETKAEDEGDEA